MSDASRTATLRFGVGARISRWLMRLIGWRLVYVPPPSPKSVIIVYPHTSNWDFVVGVLARSVAGIPCHFVAKDSLFRGAIGRWLRRVGGIPVNRSAPAGFIGQLVAEFEARGTFHVVFTPEGTRGKVDRWKSGFYRLALAAKVPLGLAFIDYAAREVGIGEWLDLSGDEHADLERMRRFYAGKRGRHPAQEGPIRFDVDEPAP